MEGDEAYGGGDLKSTHFHRLSPPCPLLYCNLMREKIQKITITFRIDPSLKEAAKRVALGAKQTLSRYIEQLVKLDLWRKRLMG